jgi:hypothetical protein
MNNPITNLPSLLVWRRKVTWLALIFSSIILCLAVVPLSQSTSGYIDNNARQLEGSWLATVTIPDPEGGDPQLFESQVSYCAGGAMIASDPSPFPNMTTAYHGTWARKGHHEFVFTMIGFQYDKLWTDDPGLPPSSTKLWKLIIKETVRIKADRDTYSGEGTIEWLDPQGVQYGPAPDSTHAVRIKAE